MNLDLNDDQRLLKEMIDRFASEKGGLETRRAAQRSASGWSLETWTAMADLGLLALCVDEENGGLSGSGAELMLVGEALGRGLFVEPFLENAVLVAPILALAKEGADALQELLSGTRTFALVRGRFTVQDGRLSGEAVQVSAADSAAALLVYAEGAGIVLVPANSSGVTREGYPLHGGGRAADLRFDQVAAVAILRGDAADLAISRMASRQIAYLVAEALGIATTAFDLAVEHLKTRVQFGQPLAANQALQHRAAEMYVELEQLGSAAILAASALEEADTAEQERMLAAAALVAGKSGRFIAQQAVQLHGAIGVTDEAVVGHCFLRLAAISLLLGGPDRNAKRLADLGGLVSRNSYCQDERRHQN